MKTLILFFLLALPLPAATTYSLVWDAPPAVDKVTFVEISKKTGTTYTVVMMVAAGTLKWLIPGAVPGEVYSAVPINAVGRGPRSDVTIEGVPSKLNLRVLIEITP